MSTQFQITIDGITPLLTHNPASMAEPKAAGSKGGAVYLPEEDAEKGAYRMEDGTCAIPGVALRSAILRAGGAWKAKGRATMKSILAHIRIAEEMVPLMLPDGTPITSFRIDQRRAVVQRAAVIRSRPRFDEWSATFTVLFDEALITQPEIIIDIANDAGTRIGVGDYRPEKNGWFGRFAVRQ